MTNRERKAEKHAARMATFRSKNLKESSLFYVQNRFNFTMGTLEDVALFNSAETTQTISDISRSTSRIFSI